MPLEAELFALLTPLCPRVYPDVAPEPMPARPFVTYQQIGGQAINPLTNDIATKRNARMQINVWAGTRISASALAGQIEDALRVSTPFQASPIGAVTALYEPDIKLYGTQQDFSIWHAP